MPNFLFLCWLAVGPFESLLFLYPNWGPHSLIVLFLPPSLKAICFALPYCSSLNPPPFVFLNKKYILSFALEFVLTLCLFLLPLNFFPEIFFLNNKSSLMWNRKWQPITYRMGCKSLILSQCSRVPGHTLNFQAHVCEPFHSTFLNAECDYPPINISTQCPEGITNKTFQLPSLPSQEMATLSL